MPGEMCSVGCKRQQADTTDSVYAGTTRERERERERERVGGKEEWTQRERERWRGESRGETED